MSRSLRPFAISLGVLIAFPLGASLADAATIYVDAANPNCPGDGSAGNPF